jgi:hypothetical protein
MACSAPSLAKRQKPKISGKSSKVLPGDVVKELVSELIAVQPGQQNAVMQVGRSQYQHT